MKNFSNKIKTKWKSTEESKIQSAFLEWLSLQYPKIMQVTFSIPNGGDRSISYACRLKREGLLPGVPDIMIAYPFGLFHGLFIEFKSKTGKLSDPQKEIIPRLRNQGYKVEVVKGNWEDGITVLKKYLGEIVND